jgi:hypothetical protein
MSVAATPPWTTVWFVMCSAAGTWKVAVPSSISAVSIPIVSRNGMDSKYSSSSASTSRAIL